MRLTCHPQVRGAEHIPKRGGAILASNHLAVADSFFLPLMIRRRLTFLARSEEHTSELQSLAYLVCRLLLEKKTEPVTVLSDVAEHTDEISIEAAEAARRGAHELLARPITAPPEAAIPKPLTQAAPPRRLAL